MESDNKKKKSNGEYYNSLKKSHFARNYLEPPKN